MNKKLLAGSVIVIVLIAIAAAVGFHAYAQAKTADEPTQLVATEAVHELSWKVTDKPQQVRQLYQHILTGLPPLPFQPKPGQTATFTSCPGDLIAVYTLTFIDASGQTLLSATAYDGNCEGVVFQRPGQASQGRAADSQLWSLLNDCLRT